MKILDLSLTYHWYDMIAHGIKKEEYREIKKFYINRLTDGNIYEDKDGEYHVNFKHYDAVRFHRGQGGKQTMLVEIKGFRIGVGLAAWGAPMFDPVFVIQLGEILEESTK